MKQSTIPRKLNPKGKARRKRQLAEDVFELDVEEVLGTFPAKLERKIRANLRGGRQS